MEIPIKVILMLTAIIVLMAFESLANKQKLQIYGKKFQCNKHNKKYTNNVTCWIKLVNQTYQTFNFDLYLKPNISITWLHARVHTYFRFNIVYRRTLISYDDDVCGQTSGAKTSLFMNKSMQLVSNIIACPLQGYIFIHHLHFASESLAAVLSLGEWKFEIEFYTMDKLNKDDTIVTFELFFESRYMTKQ